MLNQSQNQKRQIVLLCIVLGILHIVVLFVPLQRSFLFWLAYLCDFIAILAQFPIMSLAFKNGEDAKSRFYGFPIARVGMLYLAIQFVAGMLVMLFSRWLSLWFVILLFAAIIAFCGIGVIGADITRDKIEQIEYDTYVNTQTMKNFYAVVKQLSAQYAYAPLRQFAEELRYSDPVSHDGLQEVEQRLKQSIVYLQDVLHQGDSKQIDQAIRQAMVILEERNILCKQLKGM